MNSLFRERPTCMMEDLRGVSAGARVLFVAKNIEQVGDHATNIGETTHFLVLGTYLE